MGDNKTGKAITVGGGVLSVLLFIYRLCPFIYSIVLYNILVLNCDTSKIKYLLLAYVTSQIVTYAVLFVCVASSWIISFSFDLEEHWKVCPIISIIITVFCSIIYIISAVSTIVIAGWISYELFAYPWTNIFVSYAAMLSFVIILLIVHGIETIVLIIIPIGVCCIFGSILLCNL